MIVVDGLRHKLADGDILASTYPLRVADHLTEEASAAAAEENVSLNQLLATFIADGIGHRRAILELRKRAGRADKNAALAILDRVPKVVPDEGDELTSAPRGSRRG
jgi:HicB family